MNQKQTVGTAGNVLVPAYLALQQKGFVVCRECRSDGGEMWHAENATHHFFAEDTVLLLGLVAMIEVRGDDWYAGDQEILDFLERYT